MSTFSDEVVAAVREIASAEEAGVEAVHMRRDVTASGEPYVVLAVTKRDRERPIFVLAEYISPERSLNGRGAGSLGTAIWEKASVALGYEYEHQDAVLAGAAARILHEQWVEALPALQQWADLELLAPR